MSTSVSGDGRAVPRGADVTIFSIILALSFSHFLNDTMQSLVPAIYPMLKASFHLDFGQIGLITLTYQLTASLLQPYQSSNYSCQYWQCPCSNHQPS